jgi:uncharacterized protein
VSHFLDSLLAFGRVLRVAGIDVHPGRMIEVVEALGHVNLAARDEVYHACRALLVHGPDQIPAFNRAFDEFWRASRSRDATSRESGSVRHEARGTAVATLGGSRPEDDPRDGSVTSPPIAVKTWSERGGIADKDFAACTPEEQSRIAEALAALKWTPGERRTRRWIRGKGGIDLRRAVAASRRTAGEVAMLPRRRRRRTPRPLVLLCDISGSMERYSRMLLLFAHAIVRRAPRVEAFVFSTELTRVTRQMRRWRADAALAATSRAVRDWSGGTRMGASLRSFHQRWARQVLNGGPVVLLISDGWDRGEPKELRREIARLQRSCHRLVWLNPLLGTLDYAPLTRGLQAALPFVDDFLPARTLNNFADLATHLNAIADTERSRP